jgi:hypothetical protein
VRRASPKAPLRAAALLLASVTVLVAAACGSGSSGSPSGGSGAGGGNGGNQFAAYIQCLRKNGVTITLPSGAPRRRPSGAPSFPAGMRPSGRPRPSGSGFPGGGFRGGLLNKPAGVDDATWQKAQQACASLRPTGRGGNGASAAYRNCLRDHGVTATDGKLNTTDPTVQKAMTICKVLQPQASPTPSA